MKEIYIEKSFKKPIDYIVFQIRQDYPHLSENELKMLALIYLRGINNEIKNVIINQNIFKSRQSIENHLTKFRKDGIIKDGKVVLSFNISKDTEAILKIKICISKK